MRQFPPPPSVSQGIADQADEFLRGFRLIRRELLLPPLQAHSEVALNWIYWQGDVKQQMYSSVVFVLRGSGVYTSPQSHTACCGLWLGAMVVDRAQMHAGIQSTQRPSSHAGREECWEFSLAYSNLTPLDGLPALFGFKCSKRFPKSKFVHMFHWSETWLQMLILMLL